MKKYQVRITSEAKKDIEDIYDYMSKNDTTQNAKYVLDKLEEIILTLDETPECGNYPPELSCYGIHELREIMFKY